VNCGYTRSYNCAFIEGGVVKTFRLHRAIEERSVNPKVWIPRFCNLYYYVLIGRLALLKRNSLDLVLSKEGCGRKARCPPAAVYRACCPVNVFIFSFRRNWFIWLSGRDRRDWAGHTPSHSILYSFVKSRSYLFVLRNNHVGMNIITSVILWTLGNLAFVSLEQFIYEAFLFFGWPRIWQG